MPGRHHREPWAAQPGDTCVYVHCRLDVMKGTAFRGSQRIDLEQQYEDAKFRGDPKAAVNLIDRCISQEILDSLADAILYAPSDPIFVFPHPSFDDEDGNPGAGQITSF